MPNDAKLGFLVGVAGVLVAAVMYAPKVPAGGPTAFVPTEASAKGTPTTPPARPLAAVPAPPPAARPAYAAAKTRPEVEATPTARKPVADDE